MPDDATAAPPIRWGLCGTGAIAAKMVEALRTVPDAEVVAVGSRTPGRAAAFAERHDIPRAHDGQVELAADDDVDVVYVATTQDDHLAATLTCLAAGRHVLCEKPLALSRAQAEVMVDAARTHDRFLMEALWSRFLPAYRALADVLAAGTIGRPRRVEADFCFRLPDDVVLDHRLADPARGGGALLDLGIYPLNLAVLVLGEPDRVAAVGTLTDRGVDEQVAVSLGFPDGATAQLTAGFRIRGTCAARIAGDEGSVVIEPMMHAPTRLQVEHGGTEEVIEVDPPSLAHQVPEVHAAVRAGRTQSEVVPWSASLALAGTLDEVRRQIGLRYPGEG